MSQADVRSTMTEDGIALIYFDRPEVANAVRPETMEAFCHALDGATRDKDVRAIVVGGTGKNFAAGADFAFLESMLDTDTAQVKDSLYTWFKGAAERLWRCEKPTVAAVRGAAITVGCEIALACDLRIAAPTSQFGENWLQLGLMPPLGGTLLLPRLIGLGRAKRMILGAEILDGRAAHELGLVDELVEESAIDDRALERARAMAAFPAGAFAAAKAALHRGLESTMEREWTTNIMNQAMLIGSQDHRNRLSERLAANARNRSAR